MMLSLSGNVPVAVSEVIPPAQGFQEDKRGRFEAYSLEGYVDEAN